MNDRPVLRLVTNTKGISCFQCLPGMVWYYNRLSCKILILLSTVMFRAGREVRAKGLSL